MEPKKLKKVSRQIESFLDDYTNDRTRRQHRSSLRKFFEHIGQDPDTYCTKDAKDIVEDIKAYNRYLRTDEAGKQWSGTKEKVGAIGASHRRKLLNAVKLFLEFNEIDLPRTVWKSLRKNAADKDTRPATLDDAPSPEQLKLILAHANPMMRAAALMITSSGIRPDELCGLTQDVIMLDNDPPRIDIPAKVAKGGKSRVTFFSYEARDALRVWLKERTHYIDTVNKQLRRLGCGIDEKVKEVFPVTPGHLGRTWAELLDRTGNEQRDGNTMQGYHKYHLYTLRKFFRSRLAVEIKGGRDTVDCLMGHSEYLDDAYRRFSREQLAQWYLDAMHAVTISEATPALKEQATKLKELEAENENLQSQLDELKKMLDFKSYIDKQIENHK